MAVNRDVSERTDGKQEPFCEMGNLKDSFYFTAPSLKAKTDDGDDAADGMNSSPGAFDGGKEADAAGPRTQPRHRSDRSKTPANQRHGQHMHPAASREEHPQSFSGLVLGAFFCVFVAPLWKLVME